MKRTVFGAQRTSMRSPGWQSDQVCMSKCTLAPDSTRPRAVIVMVRVPLSGMTIGRFDRVCGATGTSTIALTRGCRMGPLADSEYAVDPVGVATIRPSARWLRSEEHTSELQALMRSSYDGL